MHNTNKTTLKRSIQLTLSLLAVPTILSYTALAPSLLNHAEAALTSFTPLVENTTTIGETVDGYQEIGANGLTKDTTVVAGGEQVIDGGKTENSTLTGTGSGANEQAKQTLTTGTATDTKLNAFSLMMVNGGTADGTAINEGGKMEIFVGTAKGTVINDGGKMTVNAGTVDNTTINSGATMTINAGTVDNTTINSGATMTVVGNTSTIKAVSNTGLLDLSNSSSTNDLLLSGTGGFVNIQHATNSNTHYGINTLEGSQTFLIGADLANNEANAIKADTASGQHYIKIVKENTAGADLINITGHEALVATVSGDATFTGVTSAIDGVNIIPTIVADTQNAGDWLLTGYKLAGPSKLAFTAAAAGSNIAYAALIANNNNISHRMGEVRDNLGEAGVWLRMYGGEYSADNSVMKHMTIQGGYDKVTAVKNGKTLTGVTAEYLNGNTSYDNGSGKLTNARLGLYHSWFGDSGHYYDFVIKTGKMYNEINVYEDTKISGDYRAWNTTASAEYGYRKELKNGFYITPQAELAFGRINGANYTTNGGTAISQDAINSLIGRVGIAIGRKLERTNYHLTASMQHEFSAKTNVTTGTGAFASTIDRDLKGTSLELAFGGSIKSGKNGLTYLEASRSFGGKIINKWQLQAGYRWGF